MKHFFIMLSFLALNAICCAQTIELYGEGSRETVRLLWLPYQWPSNADEVYIKRRTPGSKSWEVINKTPILQEMSANSTLDNVILDQATRDEVISKRNQKLNSGDWKLASADAFADVLAQGDKNRWMRFGFRQDYDLALASGFGMVDKPGGKAKEWEYGLFFSLTQKEPTETVVVEMREPNYQLSVKPKIVVNRAVSQLATYWIMDSIAFRKNHALFGFCLLKQFEYLDKEALLPGTLTEGFGVKFTDKKINKDNITTYKLQVKTIFNTYHLVSEIIFDPATIPPENLDISMLPINDEGYDLSKGLPPITWEFDPEDEKYIQGFLLLQDKGFEDWEIVSDTIDKSLRKFIDPRAPINKKLYKLKVAAIKNMNFGLSSSGRQQYYYNYIIKAPAPVVDYQWVEKGGGHYLKIFWSEENKAPNTVGYRILYSYDGLEDSYSCPTDGRNLEEPVYFYNVQDPYSRYYYFKVAQVNANDYDGTFSPGLKALSHTTEMPHFQLLNKKVEDKTITITWGELFPEIEDLEGFDVYVNGKLIKTEDPSALQTSYQYKKPGKYDFKIVAKTRFGLSAEDTWPVKVEE